MQFPYRRNLFALYIIKVAKWMNLVMPVIVLFYKSNGMGMAEIFQLQAVYSLTLMFFEIPTGYFADKAGRKTSMICGSFLGVAGYLIYSTSFGFWNFVMAEVALGLGQSLVSGADSAMLYDSLVAGRIADKYTRYEGRINSTGNFAEALAGIAGGLLAAGSLRTPFYVQATVAALAIPASLCLVEPPAVGAKIKPTLKNAFAIIRKALHSDRKLKWNTLFSAVTGVSTLTMAWFAQPFFIQAGLSVSWFGIIWAVLNVTAGIASACAWKLEKRFGPSGTVTVFSLVLVSGYLGISFLPSAMGFLLLLMFYFARGVATPTLRNYVNLITVSEERATVLSVRNFVIRMMFAILGPVFGRITDKYSLPVAMAAAGVLLGTMMGITLYYFLKYRTYQAD
ncbi:MAG TPA: MFS transporter [Bacteroidales bacterium]|nr:MFS transporter [Bacteroidales bacterium]HPT01209.1 MFS transporter [Bacteroidales bacterium]